MRWLTDRVKPVPPLEVIRRVLNGEPVRVHWLLPDKDDHGVEVGGVLWVSRQLWDCLRHDGLCS